MLLDGEDFLYTFSNHTVSGEIDSISLVRLGKAYDKATGELVLEDGVIQDATPYITFSDLDISNAPGVAGPVHEIVAGMMGGGPSGTLSDPAPITEVVWGEAHEVKGSAGADSYAGTRFGDTVRGRGGDDALSGRGGADTLVGGKGADRTTGGAGADTFVFATAGHTRGDLIRDFDAAEGDLVKLTGIDADTGRGGNQAFSFIDDAGFGGDAGELRYKVGASKTFVTGDTDGDGAADFRIRPQRPRRSDEDSFLL